MKTTWAVVADEAIARILEKPEEGGDLVPVEELTDPDAHSKEGQLRRDALGRRSGGSTQRSDGSRAPHALMSGANATASAGESELHLEAQGFARQVAQRLKQLHQAGRFEALHVVAAPRFLGYLRKELDPHVERAVVGSLDKDLIHMSNAEITQRLFEPRDGIA
jgi:protein required for attachment to host cells